MWSYTVKKHHIREILQYTHTQILFLYYKDYNEIKKVTWKFGGGMGGGITGMRKGGRGMNGGWRPAMEGLLPMPPGMAPAPISGVCPKIKECNITLE